jgi:hypothetical protein
LGYAHHREGCSIQEGYAHGHGKLVHCIAWNTHTRW